MSTTRKLAVLGSLYAAQGLPFGFFTQALPSVLRSLGLSLESIGLASLLAAPWALKALWAPVVERTGTLRRWILGLQAASVVGVLLLAGLDPRASLAVLAGAVLLTNLLAATQDVATDGLAVATLDDAERGWGNGLQVGAYRVGMILGGSALLVLFDRAGWTVTLLAMAAGLAVFSAPLALDRTFGRIAPVQERGRFAWDWLGLPGALPWMAVLVGFKLGDYLVQGMLRPWLVDLGTDLTTMGVLLGGGGFGAGLAGALLGGALVGPLGRARALVVFGLAQAAVLGLYAAVAATGTVGPALWAAVLLEHLVGGCATAALFTAMMDASRETHGSTDYTLQASVVVLASLIGAAASGFLAARVGYAAHFGFAAIVALAGPALAAVPACTAIVRRVG